MSAQSFVRGRGRGQASMEFVLVLIFMLVIVMGILLPLGQRMQFALEDVSKVGFISQGFTRLKSTVNSMVVIPGSSMQLVDFYLPKGVLITCNPVDNNVSATFGLNTDVFEATGQPPAGCNPSPSSGPYSMVCVKEYAFPSTVNLRCQADPVNGFVLEAGASGYSQQFRIAATYSASGTPPYVVDFNAV